MLNMLRVLAIVSVLMLLAACGDSSADDGPGVESDTSELASPESNGNEETTERPSITVAIAWLPDSLDPAPEGNSLIQRGVGETLTRVAPDQSIKPWLAESVEHIEGPEWEIVLRQNVSFQDGESLTADHVVESIERNWQEQPAAGRFLPEETSLEVIDLHPSEMHFVHTDLTAPAE